MRTIDFEFKHRPATEKDLVACEAAIGARLPADYREFLLLYNGGGRPTPSTFDVIGCSWQTQFRIDSFGGLGAGRISGNMLDMRGAWWWDLVPKILLPIAWDAGSHPLVMNCETSEVSYVIEDEADEVTGIPIFVHVAGSFTELLEKLQ